MTSLTGRNARYAALYVGLLCSQAFQQPLLSKEARDFSDGQKLLQAYERTIEQLARAEYAVSEVTTEVVTRNGVQQIEYTRDAKWNCRHDGRRWRLENKCTGMRRNPETNKEHDYSDSFVYLFQDEQSFLVHRDVQNNLATSVSAYEVATEELRQQIGAEGEFMIAHGYLCGSQRLPYLPKLLRECELSVTNGANDGTVVLTARGEYGTYQLWLDTKLRCLPRRIRVEKQGADIHNRKAVHEIAGLEHVVIDVVFTEVDCTTEPPTIQSLDFTRTLTFQDRVETVQTHSKFSEVSVTPDFDESSFKITDEIPEGMKVTVHDSPNINFIWSDGKINKHVDQAAVAGLQGHTFKGGSRKNVVLLSLNIVALTVGGWLWHRRRRRDP